MRLCKTLKRKFRRTWYYIKHLPRLVQDIERWVAYRTYDRYQVVVTDLPPGYYDPSEVLLQASFKVLKDFVEIECAYATAWHGDTKFPWWVTLEGKLPCIFGVFFPKLRSSELGLLYIERHIECINADTYMSQEGKDNQIKSWEEIRDLYTWWIKRGVFREDEDTELSKFYDKMRSQYGKTHGFEPTNEKAEFFVMRFKGNVDEEAEYDKLLHKSWDEEKRLDQEDEDALIRLAKVRQYLWQ